MAGDELVSRTVEILDLDENVWKYGESMPQSLPVPAMVALSSQELLLLGGDELSDAGLYSGWYPEVTTESNPGTNKKNIFKIVCLNLTCSLTKIPVKRKHERYGAVAIMVPEHAVTCNSLTDVHESYECPESIRELISNGQCDQQANTEACFNDGGDCATTISSTLPTTTLTVTDREKNLILFAIIKAQKDSFQH